MKTYLEPNLKILMMATEDVLCSSVNVDPAKEDIFDEGTIV